MGFRGGRYNRFNSGRGGGFKRYDPGPPERVIELGYFTHPCEEQLVCKAVLKDVPYFNAPIYLENMQQIGKVDEIFGSPNDYYISVILSEDIKASSFQKNDMVYIDPRKLLPISKFLPQSSETQKNTGRAPQRGGFNRGRGSFSRGGGFRGNSGGSRGYGGGRGFRGNRGQGFSANRFDYGGRGVKREHSFGTNDRKNFGRGGFGYSEGSNKRGRF